MASSFDMLRKSGGKTSWHVQGGIGFLPSGQGRVPTLGDFTSILYPDRLSHIVSLLGSVLISSHFWSSPCPRGATTTRAPLPSATAVKALPDFTSMIW